ncbi:CRISPR-associated endoribonuclease Cas6 [Chitinophaga filiformis]|uniref:CRISPR-associated endoribonuclease Cas6 n=1 Tax=Chitinophaga filiformis TaxID=104663 RepID=A0ABY4IAJ4_CHIFI|nr:CRISPR-associated endoribonuclease Cas6 [Chitinophaga filiformis]UPK72083.1 CRISPR-associated endoribonuclease Cas6 [Chitinophaga filiformis]
MRLYLQITRSTETVPFNYQHYLTGALHKWIGAENDIHDKTSLYSFSWLQQVNTNADGIRTTDRSSFFISAYDDKLIKKILYGIRQDPVIGFGIKVSGVQITAPPAFSNKEIFRTASPILIKKRQDNNEKHIEYNDPHAGKYLTEVLQKKLTIAGLSGEGLSIGFDMTYPSPRTKIVKYKEIGNRVNICPVIIEGSPEQIEFAWHVGVGNSTGIGFGALK